MSLTLVYLLYIAVFLAGFLLVEGLYHLIADSRDPHHAVNRRLRMMAAGASSREVVSKLRRRSLAPHSGNEPTSAVEWLDKLIGQAGLTVGIGRVLAVMAGLGIVGFVVVTLLMGQIGLASVGGLGAGIVLPLVVLRRKKRRRLIRFGEQLPDALDVMVRSLRVGHPIGTAMALVAKDMPDPIGSVFGVAVDEMTYGLDFFEALDNMILSADHPDLRFMITAMRINHGAGGNLAEILNGLSETIRERFHMVRKIHALSASGRMSANVLSVLPFAVMGGIWALNRNYYLEYVHDPVFIGAFGTGIGLLVIGIVIMRKLVSFRI